MEFDCPGEMSPESSLQVTVGNSMECSDALVCIVIGGWYCNVIGREDGE